MPVRLERLVELIHDAKRWNEGRRDYMPELGCSKCGKGCLPLCGLLCRDCQVCQLCGAPTEEKFRCDGTPVRVCLECTDFCGVCGQGKIRHHVCCVKRR